MKKITKEMLQIYKPYSELDWMNYKLVRKDLTFHHILKKCDGGRMIISNGALLMPAPHEYLHIIEFRDFKSYRHLNQMFRIINDQCYEPTSSQRETIEAILLDFEDKHRYDKNSKGKLLIKERYRR